MQGSSHLSSNGACFCSPTGQTASRALFPVSQVPFLAAAIRPSVSLILSDFVFRSFLRSWNASPTYYICHPILEKKMMLQRQMTDNASLRYGCVPLTQIVQSRIGTIVECITIYFGILCF